MRLRRAWLFLALPLALLLLAIVLAPKLAAGAVARAVERGFAEDREGRLAIGALELSWFERQTARDVQLLDPEGAHVATLTAELPSILELAEGEGRELGELTLTARAQLVRDDQGVTNLERALRARDAREEPVAREEERLPPETEDGEPPAPIPAARVALTLTELSWSDVRTRAVGTPEVYRDVFVQATITPNGRVDVLAEGLPTGLADSFLDQDGLLVDVLGPGVDLDLRAELPIEGRPLELDLRSGTATMNFVGRLEDGVLVGGEGDALRARVPLNPLVSERVIGRLVPILFDLHKPEGAAPLELAVTGFRLPLDGDPSGLEADIELVLGEVAYQVFPGLQSVLAKLDETTELKLTDLGPLAIRVREGVAHYDRLALQVEDQEVVFVGRFDLVSTELGLTSDIPLKIFGSSVARELERAREYLDPNLSVPIALSGTWEKPVVKIDDDFLEDLVKDAARGALSRGLRDLLDRDD